MLLTRIEARDFLSFPSFDLELGPGLTMITGPNGVGKTNVGRRLDLASTVMSRPRGSAESRSLDLFQSAGHQGASRFRVALGLTFDQHWERQLILSYVRAAFACGGLLDDTDVGRTAAALDALGRARITEQSVAPLWSGTYHIQYDAGMRNRWFAAWEFSGAGRTCHLVLVGQGSGQLKGGAADMKAPPIGTNLNIAMALSTSIGQLKVDSADEVDPTRPPLDLSNTLPGPGQAIATHIQAPSDGSASIPESLAELAAGLEIAEVDQQNFGFDHVVGAILHRQILLTANRRVPFIREFTYADLGAPQDLRDGSNIPAELARLKNGSFAQRGQYEKIKTSFQNLTQRQLGLRMQPEPANEVGHDRLSIDPVVVDSNNELPIQFAGAGAQEALVLSTLLTSEPGRVIVLDEPAVNVEPTMQRRLSAILRSLGQCLVITHSPDLVVVDGPDDLAKIVRLAPTENGPLPKRASKLHEDWPRWFRLLEPTDVRALLFASKVILCEGLTEVGALRRWWRDTSSLNLLSPEAANIPILSVNGDSSFGPFVEYLDVFGIPWVAVVDGPALRSDSKLAKQMRKLDYQPPSDQPDDDDFEGWKEYWARKGIFTLADCFGDDGSKGGEFEAFLRRIDPARLAEVHEEIGQQSKPQVGAVFATGVPAPAEVNSLYRDMWTRWGSTGEVG